jgi:hypothetical protein
VLEDNFNNKLCQVIQDLNLSLDCLKDEAAFDSFRSISAYTNDKKKMICKEFGESSIDILPLYDIHYGLKGCNKHKLQSYVDYILRRKNCYTFLGGDSCETATRESVGLGMMEEELHTGDQRRELTDILRPLAKEGKIITGITGNHEMRAAKHNDDNPMAEICYDLDISYSRYSSYIQLLVGSVEYNIFAHHGTGGGAATIGGKVNAGAKPANVALADVYVSGHSHVRAAWDDAYEVPVGRELVKQRRLYVVGGSLVNYFELYPEQGCLKMGFPGLVLINLSGSFKYASAIL